MLQGLGRLRIFVRERNTFQGLEDGNRSVAFRRSLEQEVFEKTQLQRRLDGVLSPAAGELQPFALELPQHGLISRDLVT